MSWRRSGLLAGGAVACAALLAACSSGGSGTATTTTSTTGGGGTTTTSTTAAPTTTSTTSGGGTTTSTAATTGNCQPNQLQISTGQGTGAAGTISMTINLANSSSSTCTMKGYPGMQLLSSTGASLTTNVIRGGGQFPQGPATQPPSLVTLAPGQSATFALSYEDVPVGSETSCPTSARAEVTPPTDFGFLTVTLAITACNNGTVHVSPVYAA
ncbi:MAG TPA: DUF4232 domain-containing protein [Acidimicrobiales bacterium]|nr:DUF4232 domain-containing protein [Acidimicrobiales bacterium]